MKIDLRNLLHRYDPHNGHIRDALINSVLDKTLARAIFNCISSNKGCDAFPPECLKQYSKGGDDFGRGSGSSGLSLVVRNISRSWLLEQNPKDDRVVR